MIDNPLVQIAIGVGLLIVLCIIFWLLNRKKFKEEETEDQIKNPEK